MVFCKLNIMIQIFEIITGDIKYTDVTVLYKDKELKYSNDVKIQVNTLNDILFEDLVIIFYQRGPFYKFFNKKIGYVKIPVKHLSTIGNISDNFDVIAPESLFVPDHFSKKEELLGKIKLAFTTTASTEPAVLGNDKGKNTELYSEVGPLKKRYSMKEIIVVINMLFKKNTGKLWKNSIFFYFSKMSFLTSSNCPTAVDKEQGCSIKDCFVGYKPIPIKQAQEGLKAVQYILSFYKHPKLISLLYNDPDKYYKAIDDEEIELSLIENADINQENVLKFSAGHKTSLSFIIFIKDDTLVLGFRGTRTFIDILCDLDCGYIPFLNGFAHSGVYKAADCFIKNEIAFIIKQIKQKGLKKLTLSGHSLGGAAASIIYLMLKNIPELSDVDIKAFTFSSPPAVSKEILEAYENVDVTNYNYENDVIPMLSLGSMLDLKYICNSIVYDPEIRLSYIKQYKENILKLKNKVADIKKFLNESNLFPKLFHLGDIYHIKTSSKSNVSLCLKVKPEFFSDITHCAFAARTHKPTRLSKAFNSVINPNLNLSILQNPVIQTNS